MGIMILTVGKKENDLFYNIFEDYCERINRFKKTEVKFLKDYGRYGDKKELIVKNESEEILKKLKKDHFKILLRKDGKMMDSILFSKILEKEKILFIVGGIYGVNSQVEKNCDLVLSFSPMTFPHRIARIMLVEQIYRGFTILNNMEYHK